MQKKVLVFCVSFSLILLLLPLIPKSKAAAAERINSLACYERACLYYSPNPYEAIFSGSKQLFQPQNDHVLDPEKIFMFINNYRKEKGLTPFEKEESLCALAKSREPELHSEIFVTGKIHSGLKRRKLPFRVIENMKYGRSEEEVFGWWLSSPIHKRAIVSKHKYSCGACSGKICIQLFSDFNPRSPS